MTKEPPPIGSTNQWATLGGKKNKQPDSQITKNTDISPSHNPDSQIASNLDSSMVQYTESQVSELSDSQISGKRDKQVVSYLKDKKPPRKAQITYLPPELTKRLKHYALEQDKEISEVAADALIEYLDRHEKKEI